MSCTLYRYIKLKTNFSKVNIKFRVKIVSLEICVQWGHLNKRWHMLHVGLFPTAKLKHISNENQNLLTIQQKSIFNVPVVFKSCDYTMIIKAIGSFLW